MKKFLLSVAVMAMGANLLTGCSDDNLDDNSIENIPGEIPVTNGVFVINNGSAYQSIDGSLTYLDQRTASPAEQDIYRKVNGKLLGGTPNDVIVYGEKLYIAGADENVIFVLNVKNCKELKQVSTTDLLGDGEGRTPRRIAVYDGKVYFTTYGGYVAAIDTTDFKLQERYQVGTAPEGLAFDANSLTLYVANNNYGFGEGSISKIDLASGNVTEIKNDKVKSPLDIVVRDDVLYVLDDGYYNDDWTQQLEAGVYMIGDGDAKLVVPNATGMTALGDMIYTFNDPWGGSGATYSTFDILSGNLSTLELSGDSSHKLVSPCAIGVDRNTGNIFIASRQLDPDNGYPSDELPGFVNIYSNSGQYLDFFDTGVEPHKIEFFYGLAKVVYQ